MSTPRTEIEDTFNGDNEHLRASIKALISLNDSDSLVPHGLGGHARALLASSYHRIAQLERELEDAKSQLVIQLEVYNHQQSQLTAAKLALVMAMEVILETPHRINKAEAVGEWSALDINPSAIRNEENARKLFFEKLNDALTAIDSVLKGTNELPKSTV